MKEVSCGGLEVIFRRLGELKVPAEQVLDGIPYSLRYLRDKNERIEWAVYVKLFQNTRRFCRESDYVTMGRMVSRSPFYRSVGAATLLFFTAQDYFRWLNSPSGGGTQLFSCITPSHRDLGPGHCTVNLELQEGYEDCPEFFIQAGGALEAIPVMLGFPPAVVRMDREEGSAFYDIRYQPHLSLLGRLKRAFRWPSTVREVAHELKDAHETLKTRHVELDSAKEQLNLQATQLRTAQAISLAAHAELDLTRTMEAVADAFTSIARFSGARVSLHEPAREARSGQVDKTPHLSRVLAARGEVLGRLDLWFGERAEAPARGELVDTVAPTVALALCGARAYAEMDRRRVVMQLDETNEKLVALGTMSAGLAHEMRNPANAIVNAVDPLVELLPAELCQPESGVGQLLSVIRDCSAQIGLLSRQLLGFRRGKVALDKAMVRSLVERALAILQSSLGDLQVRLELRYEGEITCASALVLQVLVNLIENGIHAAGLRGWISITTYADQGRLICEVGDSGPGVAAALRERIFEPFFTTKPAGQGTGLGLSTSRQIAEQHQGALYVHPTETGSLFRLEIPLSNAALATG